MVGWGPRSCRSLRIIGRLHLAGNAQRRQTKGGSDSIRGGPVLIQQKCCAIINVIFQPHIV